METEAALKALAPFARREGFDCQAVAALIGSRNDATELLAALRSATAAGQLTTSLWRSVTGAAEPVDFPRSFGALFDHLADAGLVMEADGMPSKWTGDALRLWAYTDNWLLLSQDEDLMLMDEKLIPNLLVIAREQECRKRGYILGCVAHWARDSAFEAAGTVRFRETVGRIAKHQSAVEAAGDLVLAAYLERLAWYALPAKVEEPDAKQRALDLTRCAAPKPESVAVKLDGQDWVVLLPGDAKKTLKIAQSDGEMRT
jgi:hypothetical protein